MVAVEHRSGRTWQARFCAHDQSVDLQELLADTQAYVRACGKGGRELGQETWATLSQEMKNFPDHLRWRHALLKYGFAGDTTLTATDAAGKQFISVRIFTHTHVYVYIYMCN